MPPLSDERLRRWGPALVGALTLLAYLPSLASGFLYDDVHLVVDNPTIREIGKPAMWLHAERARPLLTLTWVLNYAAAGLAPWSYHLVNALLHAANAALVVPLALWVCDRLPGEKAARAAVLAGAFFGLTPMAVETAGYVASRSTALASVFALLSLRAGGRALDGGGRRPLALGLLFLLLGLLAKEEAASVPFLLVLLDLVVIARLDVRQIGSRRQVHLAYFGLVAVGFAARRALTGSWLPDTDVSRAAYALTQLAAFPRYLLRLLIPFDPAFYRGEALLAWPPGAVAAAWMVAALVVLASAAVLARRWPVWTLTVGWLAACLLPSSSIIPLNEMVVDHRAYLGGAGVALLWGRWLSGPRRTPLAVVILALMATVTVRYERVLGDPVRAWEDAVRRAPTSPDALRALADAYAAAGDPRVESALRGAIAAAPADARSWANLGVLYAQQGRLADAAEAMRSALRADDRDPRMFDNLGLILEAQGRPDEAVLVLERGLAKGRNLPSVHINLARVLLRRGRDDARVKELLDAAYLLPLRPDEAHAIDMLRIELARRQGTPLAAR